MSKCPKCEQNISLLGHDIKVHGIDSNLKALYCGHCMTLITVIPTNKKENSENREPNIYFV